MVKKNLLAVIFLIVTTHSFSQSINDYKQVDDYVKKIGPLDSMNMGTISIILTKNFPDKINKARAIFDWIAFNISYDCKAARNTDNSKTNSDEILKSRKATAFGYAALFQDMCSVASIRCLTVDGYARRTTDDINNIPDEFNHSWDVVQLGQSPDQWYYVDPAWGSGYTDKAVKVFTRAFNDAYFFSDRAIFNLQHYPDNLAWQIGIGSKSKKEFFSMPVIHDTAYQFNISGFIPQSGYIKAKPDKPVEFTIYCDSKAPVSIVSMVIGDDKRKQTKQVNYKFNDGSITFNYKFDNEDSYPITILINGKEVLSYVMDVQ